MLKAIDSKKAIKRYITVKIRGTDITFRVR